MFITFLAVGTILFLVAYIRNDEPMSAFMFKKTRGELFLILAGMLMALRFFIPLSGVPTQSIIACIYTAALVIFFLRVRWQPYLLGLGLLSNSFVVAVNGGKMPVRCVGTVDSPFHRIADTTTHYWWLGDVFYDNTFTSLAGYFSIGDALVCLGLYALAFSIGFKKKALQSPRDAV